MNVTTNVNSLDKMFVQFVQVLRRKQGIPISLAMVFVAVAKRLRVEIEPVSIIANKQIKVNNISY
jgi:regulator of sirC expression with transglutaminase-like and TPR domain